MPRMCWSMVRVRELGQVERVAGFTCYANVTMLNVTMFQGQAREVGTAKETRKCEHGPQRTVLRVSYGITGYIIDNH